MRQNDTAPVIQAILNGPGGALDLTGCSVKFHMKPQPGGTVKVNHSATPDPDQVANRGRVTYTWITGDTDTSGTFNAEWEITYGDGSILSVPNVGYDTVIISDELA